MNPAAIAAAVLLGWLSGLAAVMLLADRWLNEPDYLADWCCCGVCGLTEDEINAECERMLRGVER